jgi:hypothetical protein
MIQAGVRSCKSCARQTSPCVAVAVGTETEGAGCTGSSGESEAVDRRLNRDASTSNTRQQRQQVSNEALGPYVKLT